MFGSLKLGRLKGVPLRMHWSALLVAVLFGGGLVDSYGLVAATAAIVLFLASIVVHEMAHALVARRYGVTTQSIDLWALGGFARLDRAAATPRGEGWIAAAGPIASIVVGGVTLGSAIGLGVIGAPVAIVEVLAWVGVINLALAAFNLLPGAPLDGGRILKAWRWGRHGDRYRAGRESASAGRALGWFIAGAGVVLLFNGRPGAMLIVTGAFIAMSARAEAAASDLAEALGGVRVGELTWFGVAHADIDTDAETMLWQRSRLGEAGIVAVDAPNGTIAGFVAEEQLWALPEDRRPDAVLGSMMVPVAMTAKADPDEELALVLQRLNPTRPFITVWRDDRLLGVVPKQRLLSRLAAARRR